MPTEPAVRAAIELKNLAHELEHATVEQIAEIVDLETGLPELLKLLEALRPYDLAALIKSRGHRR